MEESYKALQTMYGWDGRDPQDGPHKDQYLGFLPRLRGIVTPTWDVSTMTSLVGNSRSSHGWPWKIWSPHHNRMRRLLTIGKLGAVHLEQLTPLL